MTLRPSGLHAYPLPRALRPTLSQCDVVDFFCEANDDFEDYHSGGSGYYFLFCTRTKKWHRAESNAGEWTCPYWNYSEDFDPLPHLFACHQAHSQADRAIHTH